MSAWILIQVSINVLLLVGGYILWVKLKRPPQDDPRLSRGLQLLQSKISVLEDLSDRTDTQVEQLTTLIEKKCLQIQKKIEQADQKTRSIENSIVKSMEVAEIFQDKIPHQEIIERQNKVKYVKAAKMAHAGESIEDIAREVELPVSEIQLIAKVNRDGLRFDEESLPEWAKETADPDVQLIDETLEASGIDENSELHSLEWDEEVQVDDEVEIFGVNAESALNPPSADLDSLQKIGAEFREACKTFDDKLTEDRERIEKLEAVPEKILQSAKQVSERVTETVSEQMSGSAQSLAEKANDLQKNMRLQAKTITRDISIKKVAFPKINKSDSPKAE